MSKFNKKNSEFETVENYEGSINYKYRDRVVRAKSDLAEIILNSMMDDTFYESEDTQIRNMEKSVDTLIKYNEEDFLLRALAYSRNVGYLRSVSHVLAVMIVERIKGNELTKYALRKAMVRPDDATEIVALWNSRNYKKNIPNSLKKAIRYKLSNECWDAYQLRKYYGTGSVKISNLINLTHPKARNDEHNKILNRALNGKKFLPNIETAQTINSSLSINRDNTDSYALKRERGKIYLNSIATGKMGYMAMLKNLTKIIYGIDNMSDLRLLTDFIQNQKILQNSKVLPKRFIQAFYSIEFFFENFKENIPVNEIHNEIHNEIVSALENAFIARSRNVKIVPNDDTRVGIIIDVSGSMNGEPILNAIAIVAQLIAIQNQNTLSQYSPEVFAFATDIARLDVTGLTPFEFIRKYFTLYEYFPSFETRQDLGMGTEILSALSAIFRIPYTSSNNTHKIHRIHEKFRTYKPVTIDVNDANDANPVCMDYVFIISDMVIYDSYHLSKKSFNDLFNKFALNNKQLIPEKIIFWNMSPYINGSPLKMGTRENSIMPDVINLNGKSDKMFELLSKIVDGESPITTFIDEIENYKI